MCGEMAERLKASDLKSDSPQGLVGSNPTLPATVDPGNGTGPALGPEGAAVGQQDALAGAAWSEADQRWMGLALAEARAAAAIGEVPVGAVLVSAGALVARAHNRRELLGDPTAHAEMLAVRQAAAAGGGWRLAQSTLYVTLEPCPMCAGALWLARVTRLVYAVGDPKAGAAGSLYNIVDDARLNHRVRVEHGLMAEEARSLLLGFFRALRGRRVGAPSAEGCPSG